MRRGLLLLAGILLLAAAVLLRPAPTSGDAMAALGRSMGGLRVMVIDALFLRAEAQRKAGRVEDAAALYHTVLGLDPDNEAAAAFLASTYVQELMPQIPDPKERFLWWQEAYELLAAAIERNPRSPTLHARLAYLILDPVLADPDLEPLLAGELGNPAIQALRNLDAAARGAATLPKLGRGHLLRAALLAPHVAAQALAAGDMGAQDEAVRIGRRLLAQRGDVLAEIRLDETASADLRQLLEAGLRAIDAVDHARLGDGTPSAAMVAIETYAALAPQAEAPGILRRVVEQLERRER